MRGLLALSLLIMTLTGAFAAGDGERAARWWTTLSNDQRLEVQADLVLTGHYEALVDGEFGPATLRALRGYQTSIGTALPEGVLSASELGRLLEDGSKVFADLGMEVVRHEDGGVAAYAPRAVLTVEKPDSDGGITYSTPDGEFVFFLAGWDNDGSSLAAIQDVLMEAEPGKTVTYHSLGHDRAVVSGEQNGVSYYSFVLIDDEKVAAFNVSWSDRYADLGRLTAIFAASYSGKQEYFEADQTAPPEPGKADSRAIGEQIGPFFLPEDAPTAIVLNADIVTGTTLELRRALKARPGATTLFLDSDGGSVNEGLLVAHQVADRGLETIVPKGAACYSACAYVFFAGKTRVVAGELGVHQIYGDGVSAADAQVVLSDVLDALDEFGVPQAVISVMLRTRPDQMHIFTPSEIALLEINRADQSSAAPSIKEHAVTLSTSGEPTMAAADAKVPATGLSTDTLAAAGGRADEGHGYVGVWGADAATCGMIDQAGTTGFAVITNATFRDGPSASFGNWGQMKDGKLTIKAGSRSVAVEQSSPDALTIDGKALIRCLPDTQMSAVDQATGPRPPVDLGL